MRIVNKENQVVKIIEVTHISEVDGIADAGIGEDGKHYCWGTSSNVVLFTWNNQISDQTLLKQAKE